MMLAILWTICCGIILIPVIWYIISTIKDVMRKED
jgi:hypothetical protein